jgi:acyl carrier protein
MLPKKDDVLERVLSIFLTLKLQPGVESATESTPCALNSVQIFELILALEDEFKIRIHEAELNDEIFTSIGTISDLVRRLCLCRLDNQ